MVGCDGCGAVVRTSDRVCPVCGTDLMQVTQIGSAAIPIRRYGSVPLPAPEEAWDPLPAGRMHLRKAALVLGAVAVAGLTAWAGYPF